MKKTKKLLAALILLIMFLAVFNFTIYAEGSEDVIFFEDFEDHPTKLRVTNMFTDFALYHGVGQLILHSAFRFTYFNSNLDNLPPKYLYNNMSVKAKLTDVQYNVLKIGKGSFGWGLFNGEVCTPNYAFAWFIYQQGTVFYPWNGLWAWCRDSNGEFSAKKIEDIDMREWHEYEIIWNEDSYDFYIDGEQVAQLTKAVYQEKMSIEIWNDNAVWYPSTRKWGWGLIPLFHRINPMSYGRIIELDYVKISE